MRKTWIVLLVAFTALGFLASCSNDTSTDYNHLTDEQKVNFNALRADLGKAINPISYVSDSQPTNVPAGITVTRTQTTGSGKGIYTVIFAFNNYAGDNGVINGTLTLHCVYNSLIAPSYSSYTEITTLTYTKDSVIHMVNDTLEAECDRTTGTVKSSVETGTFDGAGYRETVNN